MTCNLILCNAVVDILDLNDEADWEDVRRNLSNDQVKSIHEVFATLWPEDTKIRRPASATGQKSISRHLYGLR